MTLDAQLEIEGSYRDFYGPADGQVKFVIETMFVFVKNTAATHSSARRVW